jgi:hypothetical protein
MPGLSYSLASRPGPARTPSAAVSMRNHVGMGEDPDDRLRAAATSGDMDQLLDLGHARADSGPTVSLRRQRDRSRAAAKTSPGPGKNNDGTQTHWHA